MMDTHRVLPPVQLPEPPAKKQRKAPAAAAGPKKRQPKKQDGPEGADGATPPKKAPGRPRGAAAGGKAGGGSGGKAGGKGSKKDKAGDDDGLELLAHEEAKVEEEPEERLGKTHSGVFSRDLPWLMFGFGDADKPLKATVDLVEDIALQFITDVVHGAMAAAAARNPGAPGASAAAAAKKDELRLEDLLYAVRRDPRKVARIQELIRRQAEIKEARRVMDVEGGVDDVPEQ